MLILEHWYWIVFSLMIYKICQIRQTFPLSKSPWYMVSLLYTASVTDSYSLTKHVDVRDCSIKGYLVHLAGTC